MEDEEEHLLNQIQCSALTKILQKSSTLRLWKLNGASGRQMDGEGS